MPIYEYTCGSCKKEFEELLRSAAAEKTVRCPECGSPKVTRKLSVFAARQGESRSAAAGGFGGPCGRCGDPDGPCSV